MTSNPTVSIITATYNRSNVLRYTIFSVINQTFQDWELIIVGDACSDNTDEVVNAFADSRIRFFNLEKNVGEQSGPNNEGGRQARGKYIAYLNHDDLWTSRHLEYAITELDKGDTDLVFGLGIGIMRDRANKVLCAAPTGWYQPLFFVPASAWVLRKELLADIGPWKFYRECHIVPSQNWLLRAWRAEKRLKQLPEFSLLAIQSGSRPNVYLDREYLENEWHYKQIEADETLYLKNLLSEIALQLQKQNQDVKIATSLKDCLRVPVYKLLVGLKQSPQEFKRMLFFSRRGSIVDKLRKSRGLPKLQ